MGHGGVVEERVCSPSTNSGRRNRTRWWWRWVEGTGGPGGRERQLNLDGHEERRAWTHRTQASNVCSPLKQSNAVHGVRNRPPDDGTPCRARTAAHGVPSACHRQQTDLKGLSDCALRSRSPEIACGGSRCIGFEVGWGSPKQSFKHVNFQTFYASLMIYVYWYCTYSYLGWLLHCTH